MNRPARPRVAVLFGGRSSEHSISCLSAAGVLQAMDSALYDVVAIGITRSGRWVLASSDPDQYAIRDGVLPVVSETSPTIALTMDAEQPILTVEGEPLAPIDLVFPVLHGPYGEDGTVQGMLEMLGMAYVGSGVLASAVAMDKLVMKALLGAAELPICKYLGCTASEWAADAARVQVEIENRLGYPVFVKPARGGSSAGISKVKDEKDLAKAMEEAFLHDPKVIIEEGVNAREIECGVLGSLDSTTLTSLPAEIVVQGAHEFYDFEAKYLDGATQLIVPADLRVETVDQIRALSARAFTAVQAEGLARVDFFVKEDGQIIVNEVNTMPGFTPTSMFPLMWAASGLPYREVIDQLISLALKRPRTVLR
jgi:D-alanine-D-alanine ligase